MLIASLLAVVASAAVQAAPAVSGPEAITKEQAEARLANCGARRFESIAEFLVDGKMKRSRLELCAPDSDSEAQWIATLEKNEAAIKAQTRLPESARFKLLSDLRTEIDRLKSGPSVVAIAGDLSLPAPKAPQIESKKDFAVSALPPMPGPKRAAATTASAKLPAAPLTKKPPLTLKCASTNGAPSKCSNMFIDDAIVVRSEDDLVSPVTLRFRRVDSDREGEVRLTQLKRGQEVRLRVPQAVCKGVVRAEFEVHLTGPGSNGRRYSDLQGPFEKRC